MNIIKLLFISYPNDIHTAAVAWALRRMGHCVTILSFSDFPDLQTSSIHIKNGKSYLQITKNGIKKENFLDFDVVWMHRLDNPIFPSGIHPSDLHISYTEWAIFLKSITQIVSKNAFCVNPISSIENTKKPIQLLAAEEVGLSIPSSLISNDPIEIREFFQQYNEKVIFKPFHFSTWYDEKKSYSTFTASLKASDLIDDHPIFLCPGIYQENIKKLYEVRAVFMGHECIASKIMSQDSIFTKIDCRAGPPSLALPTQRIEVPRDIIDKSLAMMKKLNIVFGCFDFIVQEDGNYIFLEVNEMGQFLWLEDCDPSAILLDTFSKFLISGKNDFSRENYHIDSKFSDFIKSEEYSNILEQERISNRKGVNYSIQKD